MDFESSSSSPSATVAKGRKSTRHPSYRGVRRRSSGKWVSEMREPNKKSRIWLGTFPTPEMAAVAHDVAALALHGPAASLNFPSAAHRLHRPASSSHENIQKAALQAAKDFTKVLCVDSQNVDVFADPSSSLNENDDQRKINVESSGTCGGLEWVDEEAIFNMPLLLDSMAEGMLLTPPAMKKGFNWSQEVEDNDYDTKLNLWGN